MTDVVTVVTGVLGATVVVVTTVVAVMADSTQVIKRSIIFHAKYRLEQGTGPTYRVLSPQIVVPHPRNRGGDPVKSLRTKELSGTVVFDGCDPLEACSNAVAVQEQTDKAWS